MAAIVSLQKHGIGSVARLQRQEASRSKQEGRDSSSKCTGFYGRLASSVDRFANKFTRRHRQMLTNLQELWSFRNTWQLYFLFVDNGSPFDCSRCTASGVHFQCTPLPIVRLTSCNGVSFELPVTICCV